MKSKDSGSNRPRVLWLVGASSGIGRQSPISAQPGNGNFQQIVAVQAIGLNDVFGSAVPFSRSYSCSPQELLSLI